MGAVTDCLYRVSEYEYEKCVRDFARAYGIPEELIRKEAFCRCDDCRIQRVRVHKTKCSLRPRPYWEGMYRMRKVIANEVSVALAMDSSRQDEKKRELSDISARPRRCYCPVATRRTYRMLGQDYCSDCGQLA